MATNPHAEQNNPLNLLGLESLATVCDNLSASALLSLEKRVGSESNPLTLIGLQKLLEEFRNTSDAGLYVLEEELAVDDSPESHIVLGLVSEEIMRHAITEKAIVPSLQVARELGQLGVNDTIYPVLPLAS